MQHIIDTTTIKAQQTTVNLSALEESKETRTGTINNSSYGDLQHTNFYQQTKLNNELGIQEEDQEQDQDYEDLGDAVDPYFNALPLQPSLGDSTQPLTEDSTFPQVSSSSNTAFFLNEDYDDDDACDTHNNQRIEVSQDKLFWRSPQYQNIQYLQDDTDQQIDDGPHLPKDLSDLFQVVSFTEKDDPSKLQRRTLRSYTQQMLVFDTSCVVQWPQNLTDETLIRRSRQDSSSGHDFFLDNANQQDGNGDQDKFYENTLTCLICYNLVTDPQDCLKCDLTLCGTCRKSVKDNCPQCRHRGFKRGHKLVRQLLNQIIVSCPNKKFHGDANGICEVVLKYDDMKLHLQTKCPFRIVECSTNGCTFEDFARNITLHESCCVIRQSQEIEQNQQQAQQQQQLYGQPSNNSQHLLMYSNQSQSIRYADRSNNNIGGEPGNF